MSKCEHACIKSRFTNTARAWCWLCLLGTQCLNQPYKQLMVILATLISRQYNKGMGGMVGGMGARGPKQLRNLEI